jgi:hypothetical protein
MDLYSEENEDNKKYDINENNANEEKWLPPLKPGLNNSQKIIPDYYLKKQNIINDEVVEIKYTDIKYIDIIKDDIRNFRKLNTYQVEYIKNKLNDHEKNEIIDIFNDAFSSLIDVWLS